MGSGAARVRASYCVSSMLLLLFQEHVLCVFDDVARTIALIGAGGVGLCDYDFVLTRVNVPPAGRLTDDMDRPICRDVERSSLISLPVRLVVRMITSSSNDDSSPELPRFSWPPRCLRPAAGDGLLALPADSSGSLLVALTAACFAPFAFDGALGGRPRSSYSTVRPSPGRGAHGASTDTDRDNVRLCVPPNASFCDDSSSRLAARLLLAPNTDWCSCRDSGISPTAAARRRS